MISTVTTTVASTVPAATSLGAGVGLIATISLIVLLIAKELAGAASDNSSSPEFTLPGALDRVLNAGIVPLSMVFVSVVFVKIANVL